ncbi:hypothetical protein EAF04_002878 [Stromatinia cepivora]|nr:hypothetical protein EAF04_002878 [Stromatinia cepivora]
MAAQRPQWMEIFKDEKTGNWSQGQFEDVLEELSHLSLCQIIKKTKHGECFYSFHPMIREWALYRQDSSTREDLALEALSIIRYSLMVFKGISIRSSNSGIEEDIEACFLNWVKFGSQPLSRIVGIPRFTLFMSLFFEAGGKYRVAKKLRRKVISYSKKHDPDLHHLSLRHLALTLLKSLTEDLVGTEYEIQLLIELAYTYVEMGRNDPHEKCSISEAFVSERIPFDRPNIARGELIEAQTTPFKHLKDHKAKAEKLRSAKVLRELGHYDASEAMEKEFTGMA